MTPALRGNNNLVVLKIGIQPVRQQQLIFVIQDDAQDIPLAGSAVSYCVPWGDFRPLLPQPLLHLRLQHLDRLFDLAVVSAQEIRRCVVGIHVWRHAVIFQIPAVL